MANKDKYYFRNVSRRWKAEASRARKIQFFSPYITSSTAETVMQLDTDIRYIYTCFEAENFLRKASSLPTLKKLLLSGCKLFHIESLHAKVMLTDDFMSIGSQNLTNKGSSNKEATFCTTDSKSVQYGQVSIAQWLEEAEVITLEMIEQMESLIAPFIKEFEEIRKSMLEIDEELKKQKLSTYQETRASILANLSKLKISHYDIIANVKLIKSGNYNYSLVHSSKTDSFIHWYIDEASVTLYDKYRYLMFDTETSKIGWVRVNKSRLTFFCSGINDPDVLELGGAPFLCGFEANWTDTRNDQNLIITLKHKITELKLVYKCFFDLAYLNDIQLDQVESSPGASMTEEHIWISDNNDSFRNALSERLLSPFKYDKNLTGKNAGSFFMYSESIWKGIRLAKINGYNILISEPY